MDPLKVGGSTLVISLPLGWPTKARPASSRRGRSGREEVGGEGKGRGEGRDGLRGTWVSSKGAVETNSDKAITGGEVEQGFASMGPDRKKLFY